MEALKCFTCTHNHDPKGSAGLGLSSTDLGELCPGWGMPVGGTLGSEPPFMGKQGPPFTHSPVEARLVKVRDKGLILLSTCRKVSAWCEKSLLKIAFPNMVPKRLRVSLSRDGLTPGPLGESLPICAHTHPHMPTDTPHTPPTGQGTGDLPPFSHQYQQPLI